MYIYHVNQSDCNIYRIDVKTQICANCALLHANNILNNNSLNKTMKEFISNNREQIINNVRPDSALFVTRKNNNLVILKKTRQVTKNEEIFVKKKFKNLGNISIKNQCFINYNFHNHNNPNIDLQLSNNDRVIIYTVI